MDDSKEFFIHFSIYDFEEIEYIEKRFADYNSNFKFPNDDFLVFASWFIKYLIREEKERNG